MRLWDERAGANTDPLVVANALGMSVAQVLPLHYRCLVTSDVKLWEDTVDAAT